MNKYDRDPWHDAETIPLWLVIAFIVVLIILLLTLPACTRIAHISDSGEIVVDRPDLYSETADKHEKGHQAGLGHCPDNKCYMYFMDLGRLELCSKCEVKLKRIKSRRPTTLDWLNKDFKVK